MPGPSRHQLLTEALSISRRMAELGESDQWSEVIELEAERRDLLEQAFANHLPADALVAERVKAILALDKRLMARSVDARDRIAAAIAQNAKGRKMQSAYHSAGA